MHGGERRIVRLFCAEYDRLGGELASAEEAERLRASDGELAAKLSGLDLGTVLRSADPQAEALARFTGLDPATMRDALAILIAVLLELGSGIGLWAVTAAARSEGRENVAANAPPVLEAPGDAPERSGAITMPAGIAPAKRGRPADPVKLFLKSCTVSGLGHETPASELLDAYSAWASREGFAPLTPTALGRKLSALAIGRVKRNGLSHYHLEIAPGARLN
jgi:hypothetical protein